MIRSFIGACVCTCIVACARAAQPASDPDETAGAEANTETNAEANAGNDESEELDRLLAELAAHCEANIEACRTFEEPDAPVEWTRSEDTAAFIRDHRRRVSELGHELVWTLRRHRTRAEDDVRHIVGGMFSPDHLGPERYGRILERARTHAALYVDVLLARVVGHPPDPVWLASMHAPYLLELVSADTSVADAARELLGIHEAVLASPPERRDENWEIRMEERIRSLARLAR